MIMLQRGKLCTATIYSYSKQWLRAFVWLIVALMLFNSACMLVQLLRYGDYDADVAFLYYYAWLINERDYVLYRDLHETSMPASLLSYQLIAAFSGYSRLGFQLAHTLIALVMTACSYRWMRSQGQLTAAIFATEFLSFYLYGQHNTLFQREFLIVACLAAALALLQQQSTARSLSAGVLLGWVCAIKPQTVLLAPWIVLYHHGWHRRTILLSVGGFMACLLLVSSHLYLSGGYDAFVAMFRDYLPLYQSLDNKHRPLTGEQIWLRMYHEIGRQLLLTSIVAVPAICWLLYTRLSPANRQPPTANWAA